MEPPGALAASLRLQVQFDFPSPARGWEPGGEGRCGEAQHRGSVVLCHLCSPKLPTFALPRCSCAESRGAARPRARRAAPRRVQPTAGELCFNSLFSFPPLPSHWASVALHVGCSLRRPVAAILLLLGSDLWQPRGQISGLQVPLVAPRSHTPLKHLFPELKPGWNRSFSCVRVGLQEAAWHAWALQTDLKK